MSSIGQVDSAVIIHVILRESSLRIFAHDLGAHLYFLALLIPNINFAGLVAAGPNDEIGILEILGLLTRSLSLNYINSLFLLLSPFEVHFLCVTSEASVSIENATIFGVILLIKIIIVVLLGVRNCIKKDSYFVSIENFDIAILDVVLNLPRNIR